MAKKISIINQIRNKMDGFEKLIEKHEKLYCDIDYMEQLKEKFNESPEDIKNKELFVSIDATPVKDTNYLRRYIPNFAYIYATFNYNNKSVTYYENLGGEPIDWSKIDPKESPRVALQLFLSLAVAGLNTESTIYIKKLKTPMYIKYELEDTIYYLYARYLVIFYHNNSDTKIFDPLSNIKYLTLRKFPNILPFGSIVYGCSK